MSHPIVVDPDRFIIVDLFAGGGGASTAIFNATGRHPDVAVNHSPVAISIHQANHPSTKHMVTDIREVDPIDACSFDGRLCRVDMLWMSPDCTHFSVARGGKPVEKGIRSLAEVLLDWLAALAPYDAHPRAVFLENVKEFKDWGPVLENGKPCPDSKGLDFRRFVKAIESYGYTWRDGVLIAADYGAPTTRARLFGVSRRDGEAIIFPQPTHAPRDKAHMAGKRSWRAAAEIIDWSVPVPSIFDRKRPLAPKTRKRIAKGIDRFVISSPRPFIVPVTHTTDRSGNTAMDGSEPLRTITAAKGGEFALASPTMLPLTHGGGEERVIDPTTPLPTVTGAPRGEIALAVPHLVPRYGEREGQETRALDAAEPYPTVVPTGNGGDVAATFLQKMAQNGVGALPDKPLLTAMAQAPRHYAVAAHITRQFGASVGSAADEPVGTVMPRGSGKTAATTTQLISGASVGVGGRAGQSAPRPLDVPLHTVTAKGDRAAVAATLIGVAHGDDEKSGNRERDAADPLKTVTASKDHAVVGAVLQANGDRVGRSAEEPVTTLTGRSTQQNLMAVSLDAYYATGVPASAEDPLRTATAKSRHGLTSAFLEQANTGMVGHDARVPVSTIVGKGCTQRLIEMGMLPLESPDTSRRAKVLDFLWEHFGAPTAEEWAHPLATTRGRLRFGLVIIDGAVWQIADVGMRMLTPRELFNAQGFPADYVIDLTLKGATVTKTAQTSMAGNSVSPPPAEALLRANLTWMKLPEKMAA